jgi:hypothetical protein
MILCFFSLNTVKYDAILAGKVKLTGKQMYEKPPIHHPSKGHFTPPPLPCRRTAARSSAHPEKHPVPSRKKHTPSPPKKIFFSKRQKN